MIVNTVEIGEMMRQVSPGTASAKHIEYRIHYLPHFQFHRPSRSFPFTTQKRLDDFPFLLSQITGVPTISVQQYILLLSLNRSVPTPYPTKQEFSNASEIRWPKIRLKRTTPFSSGRHPLSRYSFSVGICVSFRSFVNKRNINSAKPLHCGINVKLHFLAYSH